MRKPDETRVETIDGINITIETWTDYTDMPWDGDEPLEEGAEGYDVFVRTTIGFDGGTAEGSSSLGSIWIMPNAEGRKYLDEDIEQVTREAIDCAFSELARVATGVDVDIELRRQRGAMQLVTNRGLMKLERAKALYVKEATRPARDAYEVAVERETKRRTPKGKLTRVGSKRLDELLSELKRQEQAFGEIFAGVVDGKLEP